MFTVVHSQHSECKKSCCIRELSSPHHNPHQLGVPICQLVEMPATDARLLLSSLVAMAAGCGSALQGGVNTMLARRVGHDESSTSATLVAATVSFSGGVACLAVLNVAESLFKLRRREPLQMRPPRSLWHCCGGVLGCSIMMLNLLALPSVGFALVAVVGAAGRMFASLTMDHWGCAASVRLITRRRILGALLMLSGLGLGVGHHFSDLSHRDPALVLGFAAMPLAAGGLLPVQALLNSRLAQRLGAPLRATLVSFLGGLTSLAVLTAAAGPPSRTSAALRDAPWYQFTGGAFGVFSVTSNILLPRLIGYQSIAAFSMFAQLGISLMLDALGAFGLQARQPSPLRVGGVALALAGALVSSSPPSSPPSSTQARAAPVGVAERQAEAVGVAEGDGVSLVKADSAAPQSHSRHGS